MNILKNLVEKSVYYSGYQDGWRKGYELGKALHDNNCFIFRSKAKVDFIPASPKDIDHEEIIQTHNLN